MDECNNQEIYIVQMPASDFVEPLLLRNKRLPISRNVKRLKIGKEKFSITLRDPSSSEQMPSLFMEDEFHILRQASVDVAGHIFLEKNIAKHTGLNMKMDVTTDFFGKAPIKTDKKSHSRDDAENTIGKQSKKKKH